MCIDSSKPRALAMNSELFQKTKIQFFLCNSILYFDSFSRSDLSHALTTLQRDLHYLSLHRRSVSNVGGSILLALQGLISFLAQRQVLLYVKGYKQLLSTHFFAT